jgi:hypothetical protein
MPFEMEMKLCTFHEEIVASVLALLFSAGYIILKVVGTNMLISIAKYWAGCL